MSAIVHRHFDLEQVKSAQQLKAILLDPENAFERARSVQEYELAVHEQRVIREQQLQSRQHSRYLQLVNRNRQAQSQHAQREIDRAQALDSIIDKQRRIRESSVPRRRSASPVVQRVERHIVPITVGSQTPTVTTARERVHVERLWSPVLESSGFVHAGSDTEEDETPRASVPVPFLESTANYLDQQQLRSAQSEQHSRALSARQRSRSREAAARLREQRDLDEYNRRVDEFDRADRLERLRHSVQQQRQRRSAHSSYLQNSDEDESAQSEMLSRQRRRSSRSKATEILRSQWKKQLAELCDTFDVKPASTTMEPSSTSTKKPRKELPTDQAELERCSLFGLWVTLF